MLVRKKSLPLEEEEMALLMEQVVALEAIENASVDASELTGTDSTVLPEATFTSDVAGELPDVVLASESASLSGAETQPFNRFALEDSGLDNTLYDPNEYGEFNDDGDIDHDFYKEKGKSSMTEAEDEELDHLLQTDNENGVSSNTDAPQAAPQSNLAAGQAGNMDMTQGNLGEIMNTMTTLGKVVALREFIRTVPNYQPGPLMVGDKIYNVDLLKDRLDELPPEVLDKLAEMATRLGLEPATFVPGQGFVLANSLQNANMNQRQTQGGEMRPMGLGDLIASLFSRKNPEKSDAGVARLVEKMQTAPNIVGWRENSVESAVSNLEESERRLRLNAKALDNNPVLSQIGREYRDALAKASDDAERLDVKMRFQERLRNLEDEDADAVNEFGQSIRDYLMDSFQTQRRLLRAGRQDEAEEVAKKTKSTIDALKDDKGWLSIDNETIQEMVDRIIQVLKSMLEKITRRPEKSQDTQDVQEPDEDRLRMA